MTHCCRSSLFLWLENPHQQVGSPTIIPRLSLRPPWQWIRITTQLSKVGGRSGDGTPLNILQTSHPGSYIQGYPSSSCSSTSSSTVAVTNSTVYNNWHSTHSKTTKNSGLIDHKKKGQEVGSQKVLQEQEGNRQMNHTPKKSGSPSHMGNQPLLMAGCYMEVVTSNGSMQNKVAGTGDWNGWIPVTLLEKGLGWGSMGSSSLCPHYGAVTALPGNPAPQQPSHQVMSPTWTSPGWPPTPPHSLPFNFRNTTACSRAALLSRPSHYPHNETSTPGGIPLQQSSQAPQSPELQMSKTDLKASHSSTSTIQAKSTVPCSTVVTNSINSTNVIISSTISNKTNSSLNSATQAVNGASSHFLTHTSGNVTEQTTHGYMNQQPLMMVPYYQYGGTVAPYYHWTAPLVIPWPLTPPPSVMHSTPTQTATTVAPLKVSGAILTRTNLPITCQGPGDNTHQSPQAVTSGCTMGTIAPSSSSSPCLGSSRSICINKRSPYHGLSVHTPTCVSSNTLCENPSEQTELDVHKVSMSDSPCKFSSSPRKEIASLKLPHPLTPSSRHADPARQYFGPTEVGARTLPPLHDDCCASMPMTPPPTPLLETNNFATAVTNSALS